MNPKYSHKLKVKNQDGISWSELEVYHSGRDGTKAPQSTYLKLNGRWITRYKRRLRRYSWDTIVFQLKCQYAPLLIKDLIYSNNPFLARIPKYGSFKGAYIPLPTKWPEND